MGAEWWDAHSVVLIVEKNWVAPTGALTVVAPASRAGFVAMTVNVKDGGANKSGATVTATSGARVSTGTTGADGNVVIYVRKGSAGSAKATLGAKSGTVTWQASDSVQAFTKNATLA